MFNCELKCSWSHRCGQRMTHGQSRRYEKPPKRAGTVTWLDLCWNVCLLCFEEQLECKRQGTRLWCVGEGMYQMWEPIVRFSGIFWVGYWTWMLLNIKLYKVTIKLYWKQRQYTHKAYHFLIILLHFTITYALEVIYVHCICMVETLYNGVLLGFSPQHCHCGVTLVARNEPGWEYLYYRNQQIPQIRAFTNLPLGQRDPFESYGDSSVERCWVFES